MKNLNLVRCHPQTCLKNLAVPEQDHSRSLQERLPASIKIFQQSLSPNQIPQLRRQQYSRKITIPSKNNPSKHPMTPRQTIATFQSQVHQEHKQSQEPHTLSKQKLQRDKRANKIYYQPRGQVTIWSYQNCKY